MTIWYVAREGKKPGTAITFASRAHQPGYNDEALDDTADAEIQAYFAGLKPTSYLVAKSTIVTRLNAAGKLAAVSRALDADLYMRERWYAADKPAIYSDAPEALALLKAIGADPAVILAPE